MRRKWPLWLGAVVVAACVVVGALGRFSGAQAPAAGPFDHLKCFKIKDQGSNTNIHFTVNLIASSGGAFASGFTDETGCKLQSAGRQICVPVHKTNVSPAPFSAQPGSTAGAFICYNMRCPRENSFTTKVNDQIGGTRQVLVLSRTGQRTLCVPITPATVPTTTSTSSTTSTTISTAFPSFAFDTEMYFKSGLF